MGTASTSLQDKLKVRSVQLLWALNAMAIALRSRSANQNRRS